MTLQETAQIMDVLATAYPQFYRNQSDDERMRGASLWAAMFKDEPVQLVAAAVKAFIAQDTKGFPPAIGIIKNTILRLTTPEEMTELEAWSLVRRAISGASMDDSSRVFRNGVFSPPSAVVQFEQLPSILQRLVGDPARLAEWNQVPNDRLETVVQSNFMRSYRARAAHERELLAMPPDVRQVMERLAASKVMPELTDGTP